MTPPIDLSPDQRQALDAVLDALIPASADGRLPAAGALGLATVLAQQPGASLVLGPALEELARAARERGANGFVAVAPAERRAVLEEAASRAPLALLALFTQAFVAYYGHPRVREALGVGNRPPFPSGHLLEPTDYDRWLERVRRMPPLYREP